MKQEVDFEQMEVQADGKVSEPSRISLHTILTPSKSVDGEKVKYCARMYPTPRVKSQKSMCSMCASVLDELKKMKNKERFMKKKISVKEGTIIKLRNMLGESYDKAHNLTSRAFLAESALRASEVRAQEAETKLAEVLGQLAEADARAHSTRVQLLDVDVRAAKSEVKACKFEVKLKEAEGWARRAEAELAKAERRAHGFEEMLMEALKRACFAEAMIAEMEAKMESQMGSGGVKVENGGAVVMQPAAVGRMETAETRIKEELVETKVVKQHLKNSYDHGHLNSGNMAVS